MILGIVLSAVAWFAGGEVPKQESAAAQLVWAREAQVAVSGLRGEEKLAQQQQAVSAYRAVREYFPRARAVIAEAAFRRGELLRGMEEAGAARGAFEEVLEFAVAGTDWRPRALLELAHLSRREGRYATALVDYRRARDCPGASLRYRNDGREWITRVQITLCSWEAAERSAQAWRDAAESLVEEIMAIDREIEAMIGGRHFVRASRAIDALRERMGEHAKAPTSEGEAIATALESLRSPTLLRRAKRNGRLFELAQ